MKPIRKRITPLVRWNPSLENLRALSIRQPWAWLIVNGYKDVENRSWPTRHRGPLLIHAGASQVRLREDATWVEERFDIRLPVEYDFGGIVGIVDLLDCRERVDSPWYVPESFAWRLGKPRRLPFRPVKGALSLFGPCFRGR
ncbi:MAG: ASCH domain-containing protein [Verrucomicrobiales bacterium]|nr:ASCH domain-containing protein [Verrucomicrobiales bacterium]